MLKEYAIIETTDEKYVGQTIESDLFTLELPSGQIMEIEGRMHVGNGVWKVWNSNYVITMKEINENGENN